jgi:uncharacterized membrane protein YgcG
VSSLSTLLSVPVCFACRRAVLTRARTLLGPRGKSRGKLYTPLPLLRPLLSCRSHRRPNARLGRMLRRAVPCLFDERVPRPARIHRPYQGASPTLSPRAQQHPLTPTQHLSYFGVRLNLRETERKRRRKIDDPSQSASAGSAGGASSAGGGARNDKRRDDDGSGYDD